LAAQGGQPTLASVSLKGRLWHTLPIRCTAATTSGYRGICTVAAGP
jgi:hypothetical protein